ncbi:MAG: hypothetical protein J2P58_10035, partial [Acidimicrobiaceae bacterium]|nr:hypothetical protein [Acidimicrobiaceae bacterium]
MSTTRQNSGSGSGGFFHRLGQALRGRPAGTTNNGVADHHEGQLRGFSDRSTARAGAARDARIAPTVEQERPERPAEGDEQAADAKTENGQLATPPLSTEPFNPEPFDILTEPAPHPGAALIPAPAAGETAGEAVPDGARRYINRELSTLDFNRRVLA